MGLKFALKIKTLLFSTLMLPALLSFASADAASVPNPGPRSKADSNIVYEQAEAHYLANKFEAAIPEFEIFIQRYPTHPKFIQAELFLGEAYAKLKKYSESLGPLKDFILHAPKAGFATLQIDEAKLSLTRSFIELKKMSEALALVNEVLKSSINNAIKSAALLVKVEILSQEGRFKEAKAVLDSYEATRPLNEDARLFKFSIHIEECANLNAPTPSKSEFEESMMSFFKLKSICFKEALPVGTPEILKNEKYGERISAQWCARVKELDVALQTSKLDRSAKTKIQVDLESTKAFAQSLKKELLHCYESNTSQK